MDKKQQDQRFWRLSIESSAIQRAMTLHVPNSIATIKTLEPFTVKNFELRNARHDETSPATAMSKLIWKSKSKNEQEREEARPPKCSVYW